MDNLFRADGSQLLGLFDEENTSGWDAGVVAELPSAGSTNQPVGVFEVSIERGTRREPGVRGRRLHNMIHNRFREMFAKSP